MQKFVLAIFTLFYWKYLQCFLPIIVQKWWQIIELYNLQLNCFAGFFLKQIQNREWQPNLSKDLENGWKMKTKSLLKFFQPCFGCVSVIALLYVASFFNATKWKGEKKFQPCLWFVDTHGYLDTLGGQGLWWFFQ